MPRYFFDVTKRQGAGAEEFQRIEHVCENDAAAREKADQIEQAVSEDGFDTFGLTVRDEQRRVVRSRLGYSTEPSDEGSDADS